jgi:hypothetical protein
MNPEAGQAWFRIAVFLVLISAALLPFLRPESAEFVITVTTLAMGLSFAVLIVVIVRRGSH